MTEGTANGAAIIHAPPARVYAIIADYRVRHPRIVPPEYFRRVEVEAGGVGAGTRIRVETRVLGKTHQFVHHIREPEPGRVLEEVDAAFAVRGERSYRSPLTAHALPLFTSASRATGRGRRSSR